jgi:hypothetical protein
MSNLLSENKGLLITVALSAAVLATQWGSIKSHIDQNSAIAESLKISQSQNQKMEAEKIVLEGSSEIANARYDKGCEVISTLLNAKNATTMQENQPIINGAFAGIYQKNPKLAVDSRHYIGRGVTVCDLYGSTAVMATDPKRGYAVATSLAVTSDRTRMDKAQSRSQLSRPTFKAGN